jgi:hypothetical protein
MSDSALMVSTDGSIAMAWIPRPFFDEVLTYGFVSSKGVVTVIRRSGHKKLER